MHLIALRPLPDTDLNARCTTCINIWHGTGLSRCQAFLAIKQRDALARGLLPPQALFAPVSPVSVVGIVPHADTEPTGGGLTPHWAYPAIKTGLPGSGLVAPTGTNLPPFFRTGGHLPLSPSTPVCWAFPAPLCACVHTCTQHLLKPIGRCEYLYFSIFTLFYPDRASDR